MASSNADAMPGKLKELIRQVATFGVVGIAATGVHYATALGCAQFIPLAYANPIGFLAAFGVSYFGHLKLTFRVAAEESNHKTRAIKFFAVALSGFLMGQTILLVLSATGLLQEWQTLAIAVAAVPATTFVISRLWVFQQQPTEKSEH